MSPLALVALLLALVFSGATAAVLRSRVEDDGTPMDYRTANLGLGLGALAALFFCLFLVLAGVDVVEGFILKGVS